MKRRPGLVFVLYGLLLIILLCLIGVALKAQTKDTAKAVYNSFTKKWAIRTHDWGNDYKYGYYFGKCGTDSCAMAFLRYEFTFDTKDSALSAFHAFRKWQDKYYADFNERMIKEDSIFNYQHGYK